MIRSLSVILLFLLGSLIVSCSKQDSVSPSLSKSPGARSGSDGIGADPQPQALPDETDNRGRIQAQGIDMTQGERSWAWARTTIPPKTEALTELDYLYNNLTTRQQQDRSEAYQKAKNFINAGPYTIVGTAIIRSFRNNNPRDPSIRIDVEIRSGTAFD